MMIEKTGENLNREKPVEYAREKHLNILELNQ